jgi:hypothetical protein
VKAFGALVSVIGLVLIYAGLRRRTDTETTALATLTAAVLSAFEVFYVSRRRISPVYLVDAALEGALSIFYLTRGARCLAGEPSEEAAERQEAPVAAP